MFATFCALSSSSPTAAPATTACAQQQQRGTRTHCRERVADGLCEIVSCLIACSSCSSCLPVIFLQKTTSRLRVYCGHAQTKFNRRSDFGFDVVAGLVRARACVPPHVPPPLLRDAK